MVLLMNDLNLEWIWLREDHNLSSEVVTLDKDFCQKTHICQAVDKLMLFWSVSR